MSPKKLVDARRAAARAMQQFGTDHEIGPDVCRIFDRMEDIYARLGPESVVDRNRRAGAILQIGSGRRVSEGTSMPDAGKPYGLMGFRTGPDGRCFAALAPYRGGLHGEDAVEVPCPKALLKKTSAQQEEWARKEAMKRNLVT